MTEVPDQRARAIVQALQKGQAFDVVKVVGEDVYHLVVGEGEDQVLIGEVYDPVVATFFAHAPEMLAIMLGILDENRYSGVIPLDLVERTQEVVNSAQAGRDDA